MRTEGKQCCPTCGQSVNKRKIQFYSGMAIMIFKIHKYCREKGTNEFRRRDVEHLLKSAGEKSRFSDLILFGGLIYRPEGEKKGGYYGMNIERTEAFLSGRQPIKTLILKDPLSKTLEHLEPRYIHEIPSLTEFLDENAQYIASYTGVVEL